MARWKKWVVYLWIAGIIGLSAGIGGELTFLYHPDYYPLTYEENGNAAGLVVEVANLIADQLGDAIHWEPCSVDQAIARLLDGDMVSLPTLVFTAARKDQFQWVGPLAVNMTYLYASSKEPLVISSIDDAKQVTSIGVVRNYYSHQILLEWDFNNLVVYDCEHQLFEDLIASKLVLAPFNSMIAQSAMVHESSLPMVPVIPIHLEMNFLGFSKSVPSDTIADWQRVLDELKDRGSFAEIYKRWIPDHYVPGVYSLITEEYPPVTFMGADHRPSGFVVEIVEALMEQVGMDQEILVAPWAIGYDLALNLPNILLFSMDRTPLRDPLFAWIGPVGSNTAYLYGRRSFEPTLPDLSAAKASPAIGTTQDWWTEQLLKELGFTNLKSSLDPRDTVRQLIHGDVELAIFTDLTASSLFESAGYSINDVVPLLPVWTQDFYIAASEGTHPHLVYQMQKALDAMKRDGRFERIIRSYVPSMLVTPLIGKSSTPERKELTWQTNLLSIGQFSGISLPENAATGYIWSVEIRNPEVVSIVDRRETAYESDKMLVGAGYHVEWTFQALQLGETVIVFSHYRPWETDPPIQTFAISIRVE